MRCHSSKEIFNQLPTLDFWRNTQHPRTPIWFDPSMSIILIITKQNSPSMFYSSQSKLKKMNKFFQKYEKKYKNFEYNYFVTFCSTKSLKIIICT